MQKADKSPGLQRGASAASISWRALAYAWRLHHRQSAISSLTRLLHKPLQSLLTSLVIGITLALPALFGIAIENVQALGQEWDGAPRLSLFLEKKVSATEIQSLQQYLLQNPALSDIRQITPEEGLTELEQQMGTEGTLELLDENPLPTVLVASFNHALTPSELEHIRTEWQSLDHVDSVEADLAWVKKLHHLLGIGKQLTTGLAVLLGLGALLSVGNTIRLSIENCRSEIVVAKLVGATDAYVRRPFLYTGFWYGLTGGLIAILLVAGGYHSLSAPVAEMAALYHSSFALTGLTPVHATGLLLTGILLGIMGAWLAVGRHLHDMRPR